MALERLKPGDWARFERFASQFLSLDYPALRTTANAAGDLGRDSELFSPDGDPSTLLQYSVTANWPAKIRQTAKRIRENFKNASILVYATNQVIGAKADELKKELRTTQKLVLDVHDRSWFIDRLRGDERCKIAEELAVDIVDPYLAGREVIETKALTLDNYEAKAAVVHLELQWEDDSRAKGLTKLSFDALVKSVMRETSSENRMTISAVRAAVHKLLPSHSANILDVQVDAALERLDKRAIRHWRQTNEVCLTHDELLRVRAALLEKEAKNSKLVSEITETIREYFDSPISESATLSLCTRIRRVLDSFLLRKGEEFAAAVAQGASVAPRDDSLDVVVTNDFSAFPDDTNLGANAVNAVRSSISEILQRASPEVQKYLRSTSDGYTLFAFLRAVPDVQKVVEKIFRNGEIWLDTSVLLPVLAETLLPANEQLVSRLLRAAREAGMRLYVTDGVIEEVERHINRCITYVRMPSSAWVGTVPFLASSHALTGKRTLTFASWTENFCGSERPRDDLKDYFLTEWGIVLQNLHEEVDKSPQSLRWEVERIWRGAHEARRSRGPFDHDPTIVDRLIKHDVECFLGVIAKRKSSTSSNLGYAQWWLSFDKTIRDLEKKLLESLGSDAPKAPVMSPDFLANYLSMGPVRSFIGKESEANIPVTMFDVIPAFIPAELVQIADEARKNILGANERLLRRKLRDALDSAKQRPGEFSAGGLAVIRANIENALTRSRGQS